MCSRCTDLHGLCVARDNDLAEWSSQLTLLVVETAIFSPQLSIEGSMIYCEVLVALSPFGSELQRWPVGLTEQNVIVPQN